MHPKHPETLPVPRPEDYPFIRTVYENADCRIPGERFGASRVGPHVILDDSFDYKIKTPSRVDATLLAPLAAMTDQTFEALCAVMLPRVNGEFITDRKSLAAMAVRHREDFIRLARDTQPFSLEQLQANVLYRANSKFHVEWTELAELYNGSCDSQKEAIHKLFALTSNRNLAELLAIRAPALKLPDSLTTNFETKTENGAVSIFDVSANAWSRDYVFLSQFNVYGIDSNHQDILMATAPTLEHAFAKATLAMLNFEGTLKKIYVSQNGCIVAEGDVQFTAGNHPHIKDKDPRVNWNPCDIRPEQGSGGFDARSIYKALYNAERALGVQWSKARRLENDLGM